MQVNASSNVTTNQTNNFPPPLTDMKLLGTVFFSLICSLGSVGNFLVILTLARWRDMRTPCNVLIANISFVDFIVAAVMSPLRIVEISELGWLLGKFLCYVLAPWQDGLISVSAVCHTVIAIERYRAILVPFKPRLNERKVKITMALVWIGCYLGASLPLVFFITYEPKGDIMICMADLFPVEHFYIYSLYLVIVFVIVPLTLQTISYIMIVRFLQRKDAVQNHQESCMTTQIQLHTTKRRVKKKRRLVKMLITLMVVFQLCYIPRALIMIVYEWGGSLLDHPLFPYIDLATMLLFYIKHVINPLILYSMSQDFRNGLVSMVRCRTMEEFSSDGSGSGKKSTHRTKL